MVQAPLVKHKYKQSARSLIVVTANTKKAIDAAKNCMSEINKNRFFALNDGHWFDDCDG